MRDGSQAAKSARLKTVFRRGSPVRIRPVACPTTRSAGNRHPSPGGDDTDRTMPQAKQQTTVETIVDAGLWETVNEGVSAISSDAEAVFEFAPDALTVRKKDPANVALCRQVIDATEFEHYDVGAPFAIGIDTNTFDELLGIANSGDMVEFAYNWDDYTFDYRAEEVEYQMKGVDADSVSGSPVDVPPIKDEHNYNVDVTLPVELWDRATDVVELAGAGDGQGNFVISQDEPGTFWVEGAGDTDKSRVKFHEHDAFEWNEDPPEHFVESRQSNAYMPDIVDIIDEDTVRFVTGNENPYHVFTTRDDGRVDTKIIQAPRLDKSR